MKIKLILFDLDGVLCDFKIIHKDTLNNALSNIDKKYIITDHEHETIYDGLSTKNKLIKLSEYKKLPLDLHNKINEEKQKLTLEYINNNIVIDNELISTFTKLREEGYILCVCSNSVRKTINTTIKKLGLSKLINKIFSNEMVNKQKPNPEIYLSAMVEYSYSPLETLIIEDSPHGVEAARKTIANLMIVKNYKETNYLNINKYIKEMNIIENKKWIDKKMNILIPMAGLGTRFSNAGYILPKPLIDVKGKPMIQHVIENLNIEANFIFLVQKEHYNKYNLETILKNIVNDCKIIIVDGITEGAACTTLLAKEYINNDNPLLIANSDQFIEWNSDWFYYETNQNKSDGIILTFNDNNSKWSFAEIDDNQNVIRVAEKEVISNNASVGIYYYSKGSDYVKYSEQMINKNLRVNNEFYICPVYNEFINDNKKIKIFNIDKMWGLGVPEDLNYYLENYKK